MHEPSFNKIQKYFSQISKKKVKKCAHEQILAAKLEIMSVYYWISCSEALRLDNLDAVLADLHRKAYVSFLQIC